MSRNKQLVLLHRPTGAFPSITLKSVRYRCARQMTASADQDALSVHRSDEPRLDERPPDSTCLPSRSAKRMRGFGLGEVIDSRHPSLRVVIW